jgi:hypothetical protein
MTMLTEKIVVDLGDKRRRREYELAEAEHGGTRS